MCPFPGKLLGLYQLKNSFHIFSVKLIKNKLLFQGPNNPDVTSPIDDIASEAKSSENKNIPNEIHEDIKKILNKVTYLDS